MCAFVCQRTRNYIFGYKSCHTLLCSDLLNRWMNSQHSRTGKVIVQPKQSPASCAALSLCLQGNSPPHLQRRQTKIGQQLMHVFFVHSQVWVHACVYAVAMDVVALRWRGPQHSNKSGLKHDTDRHTAREEKKGKAQQNKGATNITSGMSFKPETAFDNQQRGCWIACLRPHFGRCLWQRLSSFCDLKWHVAC